jgi:hypothetical protein
MKNKNENWIFLKNDLKNNYVHENYKFNISIY